MKWSIGIDLGGTNISVGLVNDRLEIADRESVKTLAPRPIESLIESVVSCIESLSFRNSVRVRDISFIGIGVPGVVKPRSTVLLEAVNLSVHNVDIAPLLYQYFPEAEVSVGNDGDCAALGEYLAGEARHCSSALVLTLGTGIGGGFIFEDKIFRGASGLGIEPGHLVVQAENGALCSCGNQGCFEEYGSARGLARLVREELEGSDRATTELTLFLDDPSLVSVELVFQATKQGDDIAKKVLDRYLHFLVAGIRSLIVLYRPHVIILSGGVSNAKEQLTGPLQELLRHGSFKGSILSPPPILFSQLGNDAGIIGAAMLHKAQY